MVPRSVPTKVREATITIAIRAAIKAYSIAVTPESYFNNFFMKGGSDHVIEESTPEFLLFQHPYRYFSLLDLIHSPRSAKARYCDQPLSQRRKNQILSQVECD